ncbi:hypothetical protein [Bradyrhizobium sp. USDA 4529]
MPDEGDQVADLRSPGRSGLGHETRTGARVNEITQLTPADFGIEEGFDYSRLNVVITKERLGRGSL